MRDLFLSALLSAFLCSTALADAPTSSWGSKAPVPDAKPTVVSADDVPVELKPMKLRKGLTWKQRRAMGLTFRNVKSVLATMQANGDLEDKDAATIAVEVFDELVEANPQAFSDPAIDWDAILEFLEKLIPLILKIIALFS